VKSHETVKIACLCSTFVRPAELREAIACFERQDYPLQRRELIILDDAGQYPSQRGPGWQLVSVSRRFRTLGEKRNASAGLVSPDVEAYAVWDDDDIYLPWHLSAAARALEQGAWVVPATVWLFWGGRFERRPTHRMFHAAWCFTRDLFERAGRYPAMQGGEDQALRRALRSPRSRAVRFGVGVTPQLHLPMVRPRGQLPPFRARARWLRAACRETTAAAFPRPAQTTPFSRLGIAGRA
jgi:hypothetical protein